MSTAGICDDAVEVSVGNEHTCARRASGAVVCWGHNADGQLGDGTSTDSPTPVTVSGLTDAVEIAAGQDSACARRASGAVVCWGRGREGQLGDGTSTNSPTPVTVSGLTDAVEVSSGGQHKCARRASGSVVCWGPNGSGQLGDGTTTSTVAVPVAVSGLTDAVEVSASGQNTCARRASGAVVCWGDDYRGQLGDGTTSHPTCGPSICALTPVAVSDLADAVQISVGHSHVCAVRASGAVVCWGDNMSGELGDGTTTPRDTPVTVSGLVDAVTVSAGGGFTCARRASGAVACWGAGFVGGLGDGSMTISATAPVAVSGLSDAVEVATTSETQQFACARRATGAVVCWGENYWGQLGDGTTMNRRSTPVTVLPPP